MQSWLCSKTSTPTSLMQLSEGYLMLKISYPSWSKTLNSGQYLFKTNTKGDLNETYFEIPHLFSYLRPSKFNKGVVKSFQSLNIFVDKIKGKNLYRAIFVLSLSWNIRNYPFDALNPHSPLFLRMGRELVEAIILLFDAVRNFWGILKLVIHFSRVLWSANIDSSRITPASSIVRKVSLMVLAKSCWLWLLVS